MMMMMISWGLLLMMIIIKRLGVCMCFRYQSRLTSTQKGVYVIDEIDDFDDDDDWIFCFCFCLESNMSNTHTRIMFSLIIVVR